MVELIKEGVYLKDGKLVEKGAAKPSDSGRRTRKHHRLPNPPQPRDVDGSKGDKMRIKFDAVMSHDITYVGIIQTARASGLEKFPCHTQ